MKTVVLVFLIGLCLLSSCSTLKVTQSGMPGYEQYTVKKRFKHEDGGKGWNILGVYDSKTEAMDEFNRLITYSK